MFAFSRPPKMRPSSRLALLLIWAFLSPGAHALGTAAGVAITNIATVTFTDPDGTPGVVNSNPAVVQVDEILDVTLVADTAGNVGVLSPSSDVLRSFTLTNTGNGSEVYRLGIDAALAGNDFDPANVRLYLDNGDNVFDAATDTLHVPGSNDPLLAADASRRVFVLADIPGSVANSQLGQLRLRAEAATAQATSGSDAPGTVFAGQGSGGSDALVGDSQAEATVDVGFVVSLVVTTFTKTATVADRFGGANAIPGATITYTLVFEATGVGSLAGAQIVDAIPAGTTYTPGSLRLDGGALTDGNGDDAGRFTGTQVEVILGNVAAPATHTVIFSVTINSN